LLCNFVVFRLKKEDCVIGYYETVALFSDWIRNGGNFMNVNDRAKINLLFIDEFQGERSMKFYASVIYGCIFSDDSISEL
jgi:hypothetical protein